MTDSPVTPRLAATVMLLRDSPDGLEVFMVVRHYAIDFASGALVFPGGSVDAADQALADDAARCACPSGADPAAQVLRVAAIRETFEECGILLARDQGSDRLVSVERLAGIAARHRGKLAAGKTTLADIAAAENLVLATDRLVPFAHWITPESQSKRFDTHFFLAAAPRDQVGAHDGHESTDSVWIRPECAIAGVDEGTYKMVFATHLNLLKLGRSTTTAAALAAAQAKPVVTVLPTGSKRPDGKRLLRIPAAADYGGEEFVVDLPPAMPDSKPGNVRLAP
jgi:8-oxo-dGTP pyrophosphatase MutT (NUDIX family)